MSKGQAKDSVQATGCWSGGVRAERYDRESNRLFYRRALARVLEGAPALLGQGLDVGCGTGFSTEALIERFPKVTWQGVDCSSAMLRLARSKPALRQARLFEGRAESLPFATASFDVVVANFAWHWFGEGAGQEIRRVMRPGGWLIAGVPLRRLSQAAGNRALARALLAGRDHFVRSTSQGLSFDEVRTLLPGPVRVGRHELVVESERFADAETMLDTLDSRGALTAIFGEHPPCTVRAPAPLDFEWPFAVLHAQIHGGAL
jgi:SAM-dependent methyltransferase